MRKFSHRPRDAQAHIALKAAAEGDEAAVLAFLDSGGNVNAKSKTGARCGDWIVVAGFYVCNRRKHTTHGAPRGWVGKRKISWRLLA